MALNLLDSAQQVRASFCRVQTLLQVVKVIRYSESDPEMDSDIRIRSRTTPKCIGRHFAHVNCLVKIGR